MEALICLALNVYHEARGQSPMGQEAVAHVVLNRVQDGKFPDSVCGVVLQGGERRNRCQFSWYCDGRSDRTYDHKAWKRAKATSRHVLEGSTDPTYRALYYHVDSAKPRWASRLEYTVTIGEHRFYREKTQ